VRLSDEKCGVEVSAKMQIQDDVPSASRPRIRTSNTLAASLDLEAL
jgi:hypothetical protein